MSDSSSDSSDSGDEASPVKGKVRVRHDSSDESGKEDSKQIGPESGDTIKETDIEKKQGEKEKSESGDEKSKTGVEKETSVSVERREVKRSKSRSNSMPRKKKSDDESRIDRSRSKSKTKRERSRSRSKNKKERSRSRSKNKSSRRERSESRSKRKRSDSRSRRSSSRTRRGSRGRSNSKGRRDRSRSHGKRRKSGSRERKRSRSNEKRKRSRSTSKPPVKNATAAPKKRKDDLLTTKTGGAYIPPAKLRMMQQNITDKSSEAFQRLAWEALKKSINGLINKVNSPNIAVIVRELFAENIVRGRGLLCQSIIQAQTASPTFTHVYAALAAIINTKFPNVGELLLKRLILNFKRGFKRNDKTRCTSSVRFIGHMVNQQVAHEVLSLEILTLLLENPTDDSAEVAITFLKEVGQKLSEVSPRGIHAIFERLRHVLHESTLDKRTQYMIEVMFQVRKDGFKDNPSIPEELDLVEEDDQFTHMITLDDATGGEEILNVFKHDPSYEENEKKYGAIKAELLEEDSDGGSGSGSDSGSDSDDEDEEGETKAETIVDATETNLIGLRRTIYLTIQSALDFEEAVHKLLKLNIKPGQEHELCHMIIDCCAQQRTYEKFFGLMGQRFCQVTKTYQEPFSKIFLDTYNTVHRLETGKLRNVAKFYSHLLYTDAIMWEVLSVIKLNEDDTTSSSRIFIKILFQELAEFMGLPKLVDRSRDPSLQEAWEGLLPRDNPRDTRFAINFFTSIGLGGLTEDLRTHLKTAPKPTAVVPPMVRQAVSGSSSSSSSSDSGSSSSDSEEEMQKKRKKKKKDRIETKADTDNRNRTRRDSGSRDVRKEKKRSLSREIKREKSQSLDGRRKNQHNRKRSKSHDKRRDRYDRNRRDKSASASPDRRRERSTGRERRGDKDKSSSPVKRQGRDRSPSVEKRRDRSNENRRSATPERRRRNYDRNRSVSRDDRKRRH